MSRLYVFLIRLGLGFVFATVISYFFFQHITLNNILVMLMIIVGLAYFAEFLRNRK